MRPALLITLALALLLVACGNERATVPDLRAVAAPGGHVTFSSAGGDVSFERPRTWAATPGAPPEVARIVSGAALAVVYAYPRDDLATDPASIAAARGRLIAALRRRDPSFHVRRSLITEVDGAPAVEIRGTGRVGSRVVRTRNLHVYEGGAEYVVDAYADPSVFRDANRYAFAPLIDSLEVGGDPEAG